MQIKKVVPCPAPGCGGSAWFIDPGTRRVSPQRHGDTSLRLTLTCEKCLQHFDHVLT